MTIRSIATLNRQPILSSLIRKGSTGVLRAVWIQNYNDKCADTIHRHQSNIIQFSSVAIWNDYSNGLNRKFSSGTAYMQDDENLSSRSIKNNSEPLITKKRKQNWESMLAELIKYREEHGDALVPAEYDLNPRLGTWGELKSFIYSQQTIGLLIVLNDMNNQFSMKTKCATNFKKLIHKGKTTSITYRGKDHP